MRPYKPPQQSRGASKLVALPSVRALRYPAREEVHLLSPGPKKPNHAGFSVVELVFVIVILAILVAILVPALTGHTESARITRDEDNLGEVCNAIEITLANSAVYDYIVNYCTLNPTGITFYVRNSERTDQGVVIQNGDSSQRTATNPVYKVLINSFSTAYYDSASVIFPPSYRLTSKRYAELSDNDAAAAAIHVKLNAEGVIDVTRTLLP